MVPRWCYSILAWLLSLYPVCWLFLLWLQNGYCSFKHHTEVQGGREEACNYIHPINQEFDPEAWGCSSVGKVCTQHANTRTQVQPSGTSEMLDILLHLCCLSIGGRWVKDRRNPGPFWAANLTNLVNFRPVRDAAKKQGVWFLGDSTQGWSWASTHRHSHISVCTNKHKWGVLFAASEDAPFCVT